MDLRFEVTFPCRSRRHCLSSLMRQKRGLRLLLFCQLAIDTLRRSVLVLKG